MATVLLYDIDGTLVTTDGGARQALLDTIIAHYGDDAGFDFGFGGMTDRGIFRRGLEQRGVPVEEELLDRLIADYLPRLESVLARATVHRLLPGALEMVRASVGWSGVAAGLGTGNVEAGARMKLRPFAVDALLPFGGFGCDAELRAELIAAGHRRGAERLGLPVEQTRLVVVGDTVHDIEAARANGGVTLAVATGRTSHEALVAGGAEVVVHRLDDVGALAALARLC